MTQANNQNGRGLYCNQRGLYSNQNGNGDESMNNNGAANNGANNQQDRPTNHFICKVHAKSSLIDAVDQLEEIGKIRFTICDYSKGTGEGNSQSATFYMDPEEALATFTQVINGTRIGCAPYESNFLKTERENAKKAKEQLLKNPTALMKKLPPEVNALADTMGDPMLSEMFIKQEQLKYLQQLDKAVDDKAGLCYTLYSKDKLNAKKDGDKFILGEDGKVPMKKMQITRDECMNIKWGFTIQNGRAIPVATDIGGAYAKSGSFKADENLSIKVSEVDMLEFAHEIINVIENNKMFNYSIAVREMKENIIIKKREYFQNNK